MRTAVFFPFQCCLCLFRRGVNIFWICLKRTARSYELDKIAVFFLCTYPAASDFSVLNNIAGIAYSISFHDYYPLLVNR